MSYHNETCGCADCGNYGQPYNPRAIHNQSCECGNYPVASSVKANAAPATSATKRIDVPIELEDEVRAFIAAKAQDRPRPSRGPRCAPSRKAERWRWKLSSDRKLKTRRLKCVSGTSPSVSG
jgi:hypothetical protein